MKMYPIPMMEQDMFEYTNNFHVADTTYDFTDETISVGDVTW